MVPCRDRIVRDDADRFKYYRGQVDLRLEPGFTGRWQVDRFEQENCVPQDCYENVLVTAEYSETEPDAFQIKFYAPGVGNIRVGWIGLDATREELELVELINLTPEALAEAREAALELEERAYRISKEVYDQTPPSVVP